MMNVIDGCVELQCGCHDDWYMREYSYSENVIVTKKKGEGGRGTVRLLQCCHGWLS